MAEKIKNWIKLLPCCSLAPSLCPPPRPTRHKNSKAFRMKSGRREAKEGFAGKPPLSPKRVPRAWDTGTETLRLAAASKRQNRRFTPFIIRLEVEVWCVLVWDHAHRLGKKLNTRDLYLQADDKRCRVCRFGSDYRVTHLVGKNLMFTLDLGYSGFLPGQ